MLLFKKNKKPPTNAAIYFCFEDIRNIFHFKLHVISCFPFFGLLLQQLNSGLTVFHAKMAENAVIKEVLFYFISYVFFFLCLCIHHIYQSKFLVCVNTRNKTDSVIKESDSDVQTFLGTDHFPCNLVFYKKQIGRSIFKENDCWMQSLKKAFFPVLRYEVISLYSQFVLQALFSTSSITTRGAAYTGCERWEREISWTSQWVR